MKFLIFMFFISLFAESPFAEAVKLEKAPSPSGNKTDFLVQKLDYLDPLFDSRYPGKPAIQLRLAHSLFLASKEQALKPESCLDCRKKAQGFAKRSLKIYQELEPLLKKRHSKLYAESLFKQAYLERLLGNPSRSRSFLKKVTLVPNLDPLWVARAWYNIGEIEFALYNYKKALKAFDEVLKQKSSPWHFAVYYRRIWSLFNLSLYEESFKALRVFVNSKEYSQSPLDLENQKLKQKLGTEIEVLYSYIKITPERLDFLFAFGSQSEKPSDQDGLNRIFSLAPRLKKVGRLKEANQVWQFYLSKTKEDSKRLLAYLALLENSMALQYEDKLTHLGEISKKLLALQKQLGIDKSATVNIHRFFDQMQKERQSFSEKQKLYLLSLYKESLSLYVEDLDLLLKIGILVEELKKYEEAGNYYQQAVLLVKEDPRLKEKLCFKQMAMAELSKKESVRLKAYSFYIENGTQESLVFKSQYQRAYIYYTKKDFKKSGALFYSLAFYDLKKGDSSTRDLKLQSAHLSLSSLQKIGDQEEQIIAQAEKFKKTFPRDKKAFIKIYNLAILNRVKKLLTDVDFSHRPVQVSTNKNVKTAWGLLAKFFVQGATDSEILSYHTNILLLAKELLKLEEMDQSIQALLARSKLTPEDQKMVLTWKLWLAELQLDFVEVLKTLKQLYPKEQSQEHLLRLARLSELAGKSPIPYYKTIIKKYPKSSVVPTLIVSLWEKSDQKAQKQYLQEYARFFADKPEELITLILKTDQGARDWEFLQSFLKWEFMKNSFLDRFLSTKKTRDSFKALLVKTQFFSLNKNLQNSALRAYAKALNTLTDDTEQLLNTQDWLSRLSIIAGLKKELLSFCNYVKQLPIPKNLTPEEQLEYQALLNKQIQPYKDQIQKLDQELVVLQSDSYLLSYKNIFQQNPVVKPYLEWELDQLSAVLEIKFLKQKLFAVSGAIKVDSSKRAKPEGTNLKDPKKLLTKSPVQTEIKTVSQKKRVSLYARLKKHPFDLDILKKLLEMETARNNSAWSFYLAQRIKEVETKRRRR